jgi:hypothetical protein
MTVLAFSFYRLAGTVSATGELTTERVEIRPPIRYDSVNPAPGTEVKVHGFPRASARRPPPATPGKPSAR